MSTEVYRKEMSTQISNEQGGRPANITIYSGANPAGHDQRFTHPVVYVQIRTIKNEKWTAVEQIAIPLDKIEEIVVALQYAKFHTETKGELK